MAVVTKVEQMNGVLRNLGHSSADIIGSAILTSDGFVVASMLPAELNEEMISAMAATLLGAGEQIANEVVKSGLEQTFVKAKEGYVFVNAITEHEVLLVLTTSRVKLGLIFMEARKRSEELLKVL
ncbi:MAG: roadblock/LC7 domain-containing protein [Proteobacteria bacterium]|nr:roadblock/LC7 domain-containing protein [Pseudomonadota bacterium]